MPHRGTRTCSRAGPGLVVADPPRASPPPVPPALLSAAGAEAGDSSSVLHAAALSHSQKPSARIHVEVQTGSTSWTGTFLSDSAGSCACRVCVRPGLGQL